MVYVAISQSFNKNIFIYLCSFVFMRRFERCLSQSRVQEGFKQAS